MTDAAQPKAYESTSGGEILSTSYKWHLKQWSVMRYCCEEKQSPGFYMTNTRCKFQLSIEAKHEWHNNFHKNMDLQARLLESPLHALFIIMTVSVVDENMKILKTIQKTSWPEKSNVYQPDHKIKIGHLEIGETDFPNDTLTLFLVIKHVTELRNSPMSTLGLIQSSSEWPSNVTRAINDLYNGNELCDIKFVFEKTGKVLAAHKVMLAARSPVLRAKLRSGIEEMKIEDIDYTVFEIFLRYIYTGKVDKIADDVVETLIAVAHKYEVLDLAVLCEKYLAASIGN